MKKIVFVFVFLFAISFRISAQWELLNSPLATPDIRNVAQHPDGYLISVSAENEIFRSDLTQNNWIKIATLDSIVYCIKINAQGIIFTGIKGGYAFSTDGGFNWEVKSLFTSRYAYISDIEFDSSEYIFMTPHSDYGAPGVWVSNNEGETWNKYTSGLPSDLAGFIGIEMDSNDKLYILSQSGGSVYSSADEGQSWQLKSVVGGNADDIEIDINDSLYVVTNGNYLYRSHDLGTSWNLILSTSISDLYIDNFNNLFGCNWYNSGHNSIICSSNGGASWESIGHEGYSYDLIVSNNIIYSSTTSGLKKSSDNGSSWSLCFKYDNRFANIFDILTLTDNRIIVGANSGLYVSSDNFTSWDSTNISASVNHIKKDNNGKLYASSDYLYRSINNGITWEIPYNIALYSSPKKTTNVFINDSGYIFTIQNYGTPGSYTPGFKSTDFGATWNMIWEHVCACSGGPTGYSLIESTSGTLFVSFYFAKGLPAPYTTVSIRKKVLGGNWVTVYDWKIANNMYLYNQALYMATSGYGSPSLGVIKFTDDGNSFIQLNTGFSNLTIKQLLLKPDVFIALTGDGIYRSLDEGNYWTAINLSGLNANINSVYLDDNQKLYACTDNGIYVYTGALPVELVTFTVSSEPGSITLSWSTATETNNQGFEIERSFDKTSWATIGFSEGKGTTTEPQDYTYSDDISEISSSKLYFRLKQIDFNGSFDYSDIVEAVIAPSVFSLSQNYPNPFNPSTSIQYAINSRQFVTLKVYDVLGKEVATLVNEEKPAGQYKVEFNPESSIKNPASGIYFYQLKSGNFVETKKMIFLK